jgi:hypothetical protein
LYGAQGEPAVLEHCISLLSVTTPVAPRTTAKSPGPVSPFGSRTQRPAASSPRVASVALRPGSGSTTLRKQAAAGTYQRLRPVESSPARAARVGVFDTPQPEGRAAAAAVARPKAAAPRQTHVALGQLMAVAKSRMEKQPTVRAVSCVSFRRLSDVGQVAAPVVPDTAHLAPTDAGSAQHVRWRDSSAPGTPLADAAPSPTPSSVSMEQELAVAPTAVPVSHVIVNLRDIVAPSRPAVATATLRLQSLPEPAAALHQHTAAPPAESAAPVAPPLVRTGSRDSATARSIVRKPSGSQLRVNVPFPSAPAQLASGGMSTPHSGGLPSLMSAASVMSVSEIESSPSSPQAQPAMLTAPSMSAVASRETFLISDSPTNSAMSPLSSRSPSPINMPAALPTAAKGAVVPTRVLNIRPFRSAPSAVDGTGDGVIDLTPEGIAAASTQGGSASLSARTSADTMSGASAPSPPPLRSNVTLLVSADSPVLPAKTVSLALAARTEAASGDERRESVFGTKPPPQRPVAVRPLSPAGSLAPRSTSPRPRPARSRSPVLPDLCTWLLPLPKKTTNNVCGELTWCCAVASAKDDLAQESRARSDRRRAICAGAVFEKYPFRGGWSHKQLVSIDEASRSVRWGPPNQPAKAKFGLDLGTVTRITLGAETDALRKQKLKQPWLCMSLVGPDRTLDVQAPDMATLAVWCVGSPAQVRCDVHASSV